MTLRRDWSFEARPRHLGSRHEAASWRQKRIRRHGERIVNLIRPNRPILPYEQTMAPKTANDVTPELIVLVGLIDFPERSRIRLASLAPQVQVGYIADSSVAELQNPNVEVLVAASLPDLDMVPRLRWLQVPSAGVDHLVAQAPWQRLTVTNARGVYAVPMAEHIVAAALAASQATERRRQLQAEHRWPDSAVPYESLGLRTRTMVIIGYGGIGRETARLAAAFGMRIVAVKAHPWQRVDDASYREPGTGDPQGVIPEEIVGPEALEDVARRADFLVITAPLTTRSRGIVSRRVLEALPPQAWLINVGRGAVVDEAALLDRLRSGRLAGAALDVFKQEPLGADSPFWSLPNVIVTPHVSGGAPNNWDVLTDLICENLRRWVSNDPLLNRVDGSREY
jgi:phosphoglycerate dehydrogenase-like enzyme